MPATYEPIATTTLGSAAASYTFSSIPSTYTDLVLILSGNYTAASDSSPSFRLNGDSASNYSVTVLNGDGTSASSFRETSQTQMILGSMQSTISNSIFNLMNYANTTTFKTVISRGNNSTNRARAYVGLWRNTAAITSIEVLANAGGPNFATGTTFTLYGIKSA